MRTCSVGNDRRCDRSIEGAAKHCGRTPHHLPSYGILFHPTRPIPSHLIPSHPVQFHVIPSHPAHCISSHPIRSHLTSPHSTPFLPTVHPIPIYAIPFHSAHPIPSHPIPPHTISPYPIPPHPIPSQHDLMTISVTECGSRVFDAKGERKGARERQARREKRRREVSTSTQHKEHAPCSRFGVPLPYSFSSAICIIE